MSINSGGVYFYPTTNEQSVLCRVCQENIESNEKHASHLAKRVDNTWYLSCHFHWDCAKQSMLSQKEPKCPSCRSQINLKSILSNGEIDQRERKLESERVVQLDESLATAVAQVDEEGRMDSDDESIDSDEAFARQLDAEWNGAENNAAPARALAQSEHGGGINPYIASAVVVIAVLVVSVACDVF